MKLPKRIYLSDKLLKRFIAIRRYKTRRKVKFFFGGKVCSERDRNSTLFLLGKKRNRVCVEAIEFERNPNYGCEQVQGVSSEMLSNAMISLAKRQLTVGGFGWVRGEKEDMPGWFFHSGGGDIRRHAGMVFVEFGEKTQAQVYDRTPAGREKIIEKRIHNVEIVVVPENYNPRTRHAGNKQ